MRSRPGLSVVLVVLCGLALGTRVPYVVVSPGPTFNTVGSVDGKELVHIEGTKTYPTTGSLRMTTVREFGGPSAGVSLWQALAAWVADDERVVPREAIFPEGQSAVETARAGAEQFSTSQSDAIAAALNYLKLPVTETPVISSVLVDAPAHDKLQAGDAVVSVDGVSATSPEQVVAAVRAQPVGTTLRFVVTRDGKLVDVEVTSAAREDDPTTPRNEAGTPYIGASLSTLYSGPFAIDFELDGVGGPSAGSMFALAIVDKLTPGSLTDARDIAGTGTIDPDGTVGPIGGIAQKMAGAKRDGATLFLAPADNCDAVVGRIPPGLIVTPIKTLAEAVAAVEAYVAGRSLPACPTE